MIKDRQRMKRKQFRIENRHKSFMTKESRFWIRFFFPISRSGSGQAKTTNPERVCPERLDPYPVNFRPDPKPWPEARICCINLYLFLKTNIHSKFPSIYRYIRKICKLRIKEELEYVSRNMYVLLND